MPLLLLPPRREVVQYRSEMRGSVHEQRSFMSAVVALVLLGLVRLDEVYASVDWPVIVLLDAMIPVGTAVEATGAETVASRSGSSLRSSPFRSCWSGRSSQFRARTRAAAAPVPLPQVSRLLRHRLWSARS